MPYTLNHACIRVCLLSYTRTVACAYTYTHLHTHTCTQAKKIAKTVGPPQCAKSYTGHDCSLAPKPEENEGTCPQGFMCMPDPSQCEECACSCNTPADKLKNLGEYVVGVMCVCVCVYIYDTYIYRAHECEVCACSCNTPLP